MVTVSRPIEGISLNGNETLLDAQGNVMRFPTVEDAQAFLIAAGIPPSSLGSFTYDDDFDDDDDDELDDEDEGSDDEE